MNWGFWFMVFQVVSCAGAAVGFGLIRNYPIAWVWACYSLANIGFAVVAWRGV